MLWIRGFETSVGGNLTEILKHCRYVESRVLVRYIDSGGVDLADLKEDPNGTIGLGGMGGLFGGGLAEREI